MTARWASKEAHPRPTDRRTLTDAISNTVRQDRSNTIARTRHQDNEETQSTVAAALWTQTAASTPTGHDPHHSTVEAHPRPSDPGTSTVAAVSKRGVGQQRRRDEHSVFRLHSTQRHRHQSTRGVCPDEMLRSAVFVRHIRLRRVQYYQTTKVRIHDWRERDSVHTCQQSHPVELLSLDPRMSRPARQRRSTANPPHR